MRRSQLSTDIVGRLLLVCYVRVERSTRLEWEGYDQVS